MKKINLLLLLMVLVISANICVADTVMINGKVYLENQIDHSNIKVLLRRIEPSISNDSTFTSSDGAYSITIETGAYIIEFSKEGYITEELDDRLLYSDTTFDDVTLLGKPPYWNVPTDFSTIQAAIDFSVNGDTVLVAPGTYVENINFNGKNITVASYFFTSNDSTYISQTLIDGNKTDSVVSFESGEDSTTALIGFTLTNGARSAGGGIFCKDSSPKLIHLDIRDNIYPMNSSQYKGGGIYFYRSNSTLSHVKISGNIVNEGPGGGIYCENSSIHFYDVSIKNNMIRNKYNMTTGLGGGLLCRDCQDIVLSNVSICNNSSREGGGLFLSRISNIIINNSLIEGNNALSTGGGINVVSSDLFKISNTIINGNIAGNSGGGICSQYDSKMDLFNTTIVNNQAEISGSGYLQSSETSMTFINCIIAFNKGEHALFNSEGTVEVNYSNFWENGDFENIGEYVGVNVMTNANGDSCDMYNNINTDPSFLKRVESNFYLSDFSHCIAACTSDSAPEFDFAGNPRGIPPDMGAFENPLNKPSTSDIVVQGFVFLESQAAPSGIEITFVNSFTSEIIGSTIASSDGSYSLAVKAGTYDVIFSMDGYFTESLYNFEIYENITIDNVYLPVYTHFVNVPADFPTIQEAINYVFPGDTVIVAPGTYYENIDFNGKSLTVRALHDPDINQSHALRSVIDANLNGHVVEFSKGEGSTSVLKGFVITGGFKESDYSYKYPLQGGGIYCLNSSPILENLIIVGNRTTDDNLCYGGGIYCENASPIIKNVTIRQNHAESLGGGIYCTNNSNPQLINVDILGNSVNEQSGRGGGIYCDNNSSPIISDFYISYADWGGIICKNNSNPEISNGIIDNSTWCGILCDNANPILYDVVVQNTFHAYDFEDQIGVMCTNNSKPLLTNLTITSTNERIADCGIGVLCEQFSSPVLKNVVISKNKDKSWIGIKCTQASNPEIINATMSGNIATGDSGTRLFYGVLCDTQCDPKIINTIIEGHDYGVYSIEGNPSISYSNFWNNSQNNFFGVDSSIGTINSTNTKGNPCDKFNNIQLNPLFVSDDDYHLSSNSPCIGAGTSEGAPQYDIEGNPRPSLPSIGAYEGDIIVNVEDDTIIEFSEDVTSYPNPFNPTTTISYSMAEAGHVTLSVYNLSGQKVATLVDSTMPAGNHQTLFDGSHFASGMYFYRFESGGIMRKGKMLLIK